MPEEPDLSSEDIDILDQNIRKRVEAKKRNREEAHLHSIANRILQALQSKPDGMHWAEIRGMFDESHSDQQIRQALLALKTTGRTTYCVEKAGDEKFLLAAS